ncbi:MAG: class I SAM-dependent methyltransferase [Aggregatilineales bacterium]
MDSFYDTIARYYDPENDDVVDDLALYSELADEIDGLILDVGCGTGRVTFHLATEGHQVHGIDRSPEMLARARRKQAQRSDLRERCTLIEGDILTDPLPAYYDLIILPYNTFMHLHAEGEQQRTLERLAHVLSDGGRLVIDVPNAGEAFASEHDGALTLERTFTEPETGHLVMQQAVTRLDRTEQLQYISWIYDEIDANNIVHRTVAPLTLRYVFPREMDLMLAVAGLRRIERYGDYDQSAFEDGCARMIVVAGRG